MQKRSHPQGGGSQSVSLQGPLGPVSEVHGVFCTRDVSSTTGATKGLQRLQILLYSSEDGFSCLAVTVLVRKPLALQGSPVNQEGNFHLNYVGILRHRHKWSVGIFR